ncbi:MAG: hypothetical protein ACRDCN_10420 [Tannerellaceae bacterium]
MNKIDELYTLLRNKPSREEDFLYWFLDISKLLMNHFALEYNGRIARLEELEFYYNDNPDSLDDNLNSVHADDTSHRNDIQRRFPTWYFHHTGPHEHSGYKALHYTGLDFCFGDESICFGILIRAINEINDEPLDDGYEYGPSNLLLKRIFPALGIYPDSDTQSPRKILNRIEYLDIMKQIETGSIFDHRILKCIPFHREPQAEVYFAPRVGLNPKHKFCDKPYRFITSLDKKHLEKGVINDYILKYEQPI